MKYLFNLVSTLLLLSACTPPNPAYDPSQIPLQPETMSFFITSEGLGDGGNLGGLVGADAHCQKLADTIGAKDKTWKAYLSTTQENARDRIGSGPWHNARGVLIATDIEALHSETPNRITKSTALDEKGDIVPGRGDSPNVHDILTGSTPEGRLSKDQTCGDWTQNSGAKAMVGHHDRIGLGFGPSTQSWNSAHESLGCTPDELKTTGGAGLLYCFASD